METQNCLQSKSAINSLFAITAVDIASNIYLIQSLKFTKKTYHFYITRPKHTEINKKYLEYGFDTAFPLISRASESFLAEDFRRVFKNNKKHANKHQAEVFRRFPTRRFAKGIQK